MFIKITANHLLAIEGSKVGEETSRCFPTWPARLLQIDQVRKVARIGTPASEHLGACMVNIWEYVGHIYVNTCEYMGHIHVNI